MDNSEERAQDELIAARQICADLAVSRRMAKRADGDRFTDTDDECRDRYISGFWDDQSSVQAAVAALAYAAQQTATDSNADQNIKSGTVRVAEFNAAMRAGTAIFDPRDDSNHPLHDIVCGWCGEIHLAAGCDSNAVPVGDADLHDVVTHRRAWREALEQLKALTGDDNGTGYWSHELAAFDRTFDKLAALASHPIAPAVADVAELVEQAALDAADGIERYLTDPSAIWGLPDLPDEWMTALRSICVAEMQSAFPKLLDALEARTHAGDRVPARVWNDETKLWERPLVVANEPRTRQVVAAPRWTDVEWHRLNAIVHKAIVNDAPPALTDGQIDVLADAVTHALDDDNAKAFLALSPAPAERSAQGMRGGIVKRVTAAKLRRWHSRLGRAHAIAVAVANEYCARDERRQAETRHAAPYGREIVRWMRKAYESSLAGAFVVCLVPARTDTAWWHDYAMRGRIEFLRGRLVFGGQKKDAPFPSAIVVFDYRDSDASFAEDRDSGLSGEAVAARAEGIAQPLPAASMKGIEREE